MFSKLYDDEFEPEPEPKPEMSSAGVELFGSSGGIGYSDIEGEPWPGDGRRKLGVSSTAVINLKCACIVALGMVGGIICIYIYSNINASKGAMEQPAAWALRGRDVCASALLRMLPAGEFQRTSSRSAK